MSILLTQFTDGRLPNAKKKKRNTNAFTDGNLPQ